MKKYTLLVIAVIGLLLLNAAMVAFLLLRRPPQPMGGRPGFGKEGPKQIIIDRLHFDKGQAANYEALIKEHQHIIRSLNDSIKETKDELYRTLTVNNPAGKDSLIDRIGSLQRRVEVTHYAHFMDIRKLCRPDQVEAFNDLANDLSGFFGADKKGPLPPPGR